MGSKEREVMVNSFILCNFNHCPLVWLFYSNTLEALRLALSDYTSSYRNRLVNAESTTIHINSTRLLALEIYKSLQNLNLAFVKDHFLRDPSSYNLRKNDVVVIPKVKTTKNGIKSISCLGPKICNSLLNEIKSSRNAN